MGRYRRTTVSGDVIEIEEFTRYETMDRCHRRGMSLGETEEGKAEYNRRQSVRKLARLINANFKEGDLFVTLTHRERCGKEEADKALTNFIRRLKRWRKKRELPELKYIAVTESEKRVHHHLIINRMDANALYELWTAGRIMVSRLEPGGDYTGLTVYITKEEKELQKRRWRQSKNLAKPKVTLKKLRAERGRKLYPPRGYTVLESYEYYSSHGGAASYLRALRNGGADYGGCG